MQEECQEVMTNVDVLVSDVVSCQLQRQSDVWASFSALANRSSLVSTLSTPGEAASNDSASEELQLHVKMCEDRGESPGNVLEVDSSAHEQREEKRNAAVASSVVRDAILESERLLKENQTLRIRLVEIVRATCALLKSSCESMPVFLCFSLDSTRPCPQPLQSKVS